MIASEELLDDRYRILDHLGHTDYSDTYLAEDLNQKRYIIKELILDLPTSEMVEKTEKLLFEYAEPLYHLKHPQLARFYEVLVIRSIEKTHFFIIQEYITGITYQELLHHRQQKNRLFNELEIIILFLNLLPVLKYIHQQQVTHDNISLDHILLRYHDAYPVLVDVNILKKVAWTLNPEQFEALLTHPDKTSYTHQVQTDFYHLAMIGLTLLSGKNPMELLNKESLEWSWEKEIKIGSKLKRIMRKMMSHNPIEQFKDAEAIIVELSSISSPKTLISPVNDIANIPYSFLNLIGKLSIILAFVTLAGGLGWFLGSTWLKGQLNSNKSTPSPTETIDNNSSLSSVNNPNNALTLETERKRQEELDTLRQELNLSSTIYNKIINQLFWITYPSQANRILSLTKPEDQEWRQKRDDLAKNLLENLKSFDNNEIIAKIGKYNNDDWEKWKSRINRLRISSRSLKELTNAKFESLFNFPFTDDLLSQSLGQIWYSLAELEVQNLLKGNGYQEVNFLDDSSPLQINDDLSKGEGKVYLLRLNAGNNFNIKFDNQSDFLLFLYSPTGEYELLQNSSAKEWSGQFPETGYYELLVISKSSTMTHYSIEIQVSQP